LKGCICTIELTFCKLILIHLKIHVDDIYQDQSKK